MSSSLDQHAPQQGESRISATGAAVVAPSTTIAVDVPHVEATSMALPRATAGLPRMDLGDFLSRPVRIQTYSSAAFATAPEIVFHFDPWVSYLSNAEVRSKTTNFQYIRGELEVTCVPTCSPAMYGVVDVALYPALGAGTQPGYSYMSYKQARALRYASIDLSLANTVSFKVPWLWSFEYAELDTGGPAGAWTVNVVAYHNLVSGIDGGETNLSMTFYARLLPGYELCLPTYQSGEEALGAWSTAREWVRTRLMGVRPQMLDATASVDSDVYGTPLALMGDGAQEQPALGGPPVEDLLDLKTFCARPALVSRFQMTNANTRGTTLATLPVAPGLCDSKDRQVDETQLSPVGHPGLAFARWRGTIHFDVEILAPTTSRGTMEVYWSPDSLISSDVSLSTCLAVVQTCGRQRHRFTIGWARNAYFLPFAVLPWAGSAKDPTPADCYPYANGFLGFKVLNPCECVNPEAPIYIRVWISGSDMEYAVPTAVVQRWDANPSPPVFAYHPVYRLATYQSGTAWPGAPLGGTMKDDKPENHVLVPPSRKMGGVAYPGQTFTSLLELAQKPTSYKIWRNSADFGVSNPTGWPQDASNNPLFGMRVWELRGPQGIEREKYWTLTNLSDMGGYNFGAFVVRCFAGWSATQHYSVATATPQAVEFSILPAVYFNNEEPWKYLGLYGVPGSAIQHTGQQGAVTFTVPYCGGASFYTTGPPNEVDSYVGNDCLTLRVGLSADPGDTNNSVVGTDQACVRAQYYHSLGSDLRVFEFRGTPIVKFRPNVATVTPQVYGFTQV